MGGRILGGKYQSFYPAYGCVFRADHSGSGNSCHLAYPDEEKELKDKKGRKSRESLDWSWEYVKLKGEGINLGQDYKEHKKYLMNLYENRDYLRLWDALTPYHNMMNKYRKKGEVYIPDQEIFDLYMKMLAVQGEDKRVKQIKSAI